MAKELKPCMCGGAAGLSTNCLSVDGDVVDTRYRICCTECGIHAGLYEDADDAARGWNARRGVTEAVRQATIAQVRRQVNDTSQEILGSLITGMGQHMYPRKRITVEEALSVVGQTIGAILDTVEKEED